MSKEEKTKSLKTEEEMKSVLFESYDMRTPKYFTPLFFAFIIMAIAKGISSIVNGHIFDGVVTIIGGIFLAGVLIELITIPFAILFELIKLNGRDSVQAGNETSK